MRALTIPILITRHGYRACHIVNFVLALRMKFRKNERLERRKWKINRVLSQHIRRSSWHGIQHSACRYTLPRSLKRMCQLCLLSLTESAEQRFGVSYVPPEIDEGWRGPTISKSGIPLAGRKIKTLHWCPLGRALARF